MMKKIVFTLVTGVLAFSCLSFPQTSYAATQGDYQAIPPFISSGASPLVMLVMGRNHKLYYEAYNDASDLNDDGILDIRYSPATIDYYGYFDSNKCYTYANQLFSPKSVTTDKTCSGTGEWSGDFLNYLTMSRMDTLRKVLYGGYRYKDGKANEDTILERVFIPQDGHSWGKEYASIEVDGYDIADYTPFTAPAAGSGLRHLFASTTLTSSTNPPVLRYALNNTHRIWEWVAKEGPVADNSIETPGGNHPGHPENHAEFEALVSTFANSTYRQTPPLIPAGTTNINGGGDYGDNYLAIFTGTLNVATEGDYSIAVDGDDAVEVIIDGGTANEQIIGYYKGHPACYCNDHNKSIFLSAGEHTLEFRMEEASGGDRWYLSWKGPDSGSSWEKIPANDTAGISDLTFNTYSLLAPASTIVDLVVRVKVCDSSVGLESNCTQYPDGNYKPTGLLQRHGETDRMYFGLMTGSYANNTSGGVLRKQVGSITDEIYTTTNGRFKSDAKGIIHTINSMRIYGWNYGTTSYSDNCGWITNGPMKGGQCVDWGNPVGEMMYETLRYFAGKGSGTSSYLYSESGSADAKLGLGLASWSDPYDADDGFPHCSKPFMLILSDINPTFDSDELPGVYSGFGTGLTNDLPGTGFDAEAEADAIFAAETISGNKYIGQSGSIFDGACTEKEITSFGDIRGLCPEEPTKGGSYYAAAVAKYGHLTDLQPNVEGKQNVSTYAVGLASPLPRIDLTVGDTEITLVPFGKTVGATHSTNPTKVWKYWPTNTIVDFFVEDLGPTSGIFRINYEDVEQGADHDMDNIVVYTYQLVGDSGANVTDPADATAVDITLETTYASGNYIQHAGYIISGTTTDGTYLEVTDHDTPANKDLLVFLDTPPNTLPITSADDVNPPRDKSGNTHNVALGVLPKKTTRRFSPDQNSTGAAQLLENPLWYAAKWGSFDDIDNDGTPKNTDESNKEWDKDGDGIPDTYFYVTNPLRLEQQLNKSFASILNQASSGTSVSVISNGQGGEGAIYQSIFYPSKTDNDGNTVNWAGQIHGFLIDAYGNMREDTNGNKKLDLVDDYIIISNEDGTTRRYADTDGDQKIDLTAGDTDEGSVDLDTIKYLWVTTDWLNDSNLNTIEQRNVYISNETNRHIFTWVDGNSSGVVDSGEIKDFVWPSSAPSVDDLDDMDELYPYLTLYPSFWDTPAAISSLSSADFDTFLVEQTERQINFIRGKDYLDNAGNPVPLTDGTNDIVGTEMRSRLYNGGTWRLGDITYSTPTLAGRPAENLHLIYRDLSYVPFIAKYWNRRQVLYTGANDGMVHAFNAGFYDPTSKGFYTDYSAATYSNSTGPALGAELWAYVPFNLLPHLYWLTETSYDEKKHVYYVDLKPRIFDAKIFTEEEQCSDIYDAGCIHPSGWGTVMVIGMRLGGGSIIADTKKGDRSTKPDGDEPIMKSAFMIFDITNPEAPPKLLAELTMPRMGFSTCYPTVVAMKDGNHNGIFEDYNEGAPESGENRWFLAFGSGPADANGDPGQIDPLTGVYDDTILHQVKSLQPGQFYMLDLVKLASNNELYTLDDKGKLTAGLNIYTSFDENTFVSDPTTVDFDLNYNAEAVYFGTISGYKDNWGGKLRRIVIDGFNDPSKWHADNIMLDAEQPISASPTISQDDDGRNWVFFGTGRFFTSVDKLDINQQSYYGLKEPLDSTTEKRDWSSPSPADLLDVTAIDVYTDRSIVAANVAADAYDVGGTEKTWEDLTATIASKDGWQLDFDTGERNISQASLLRGALTFTTFTPNEDICSAEGSSDLWALFYKTGTAYPTSILGTTIESIGGVDKEKSEPKIHLGAGMASSPSIHAGRGGKVTAIVGGSGGSDGGRPGGVSIDIESPLSNQTGMQSWKLE